MFSDADYFVHVDSDCVFKRQRETRSSYLSSLSSSSSSSSSSSFSNYRKVRRNDFVDDKGRVRVRRVPFSSLPENFQRWKRAAEGMLGGKENVDLETMSCFPLVFPRLVYQLAREAVVESWKDSNRTFSSSSSSSPSSSSSSSSFSHSRFFDIVTSLDDFGEFTLLGHVLTTRLKRGEWWLPDAADFENSAEGKEGSDYKSPKTSMCELVDQAWSWGNLTPEAAVEAERALRLGW